MGGREGPAPGEVRPRAETAWQRPTPLTATLGYENWTGNVPGEVQPCDPTVGHNPTQASTIDRNRAQSTYNGFGASAGGGSGGGSGGTIDRADRKQSTYAGFAEEEEV